MSTARFSGTLLSFAEETAQAKANLSFILTDFLPNANRQAIHPDEADRIVATALHTPIKIAFDGSAWHGHAGAVPIGTITNAISVNGAVVAEGVIWEREAPDVYKALQEVARTDPTDIQFSWEVGYTEAVEEDGVVWMRGCEVLGVAIVNEPAYRGRTHLLALASTDSPSGESESASTTPQLEQNAVSPSDDMTALLESLQQELAELRAFRDRVQQQQRLEQRLRMVAGLHNDDDDVTYLASVLPDDHFQALVRVMTRIATAVQQHQPSAALDTTVAVATTTTVPAVAPTARLSYSYAPVAPPQMIPNPLVASSTPVSVRDVAAFVKQALS